MAVTLQLYTSALLSDTQVRVTDRTGVSPGVSTGYPRAITSDDTILITVVPTGGGSYIYEGGLLAHQAATGSTVLLSLFEDGSTGYTLDEVAHGGWWTVSYEVNLRDEPDGPPTNTYTSTETALYDSVERCAALSCYLDGLETDCGCGCDGKELTAFKVVGHLQMSRDLMAQGNAPAARQAYQLAYTLAQTCDCNC
jgi:hypothetical protein